MAYLAVYVARNTLGAVAPKTGFSEAFLGKTSSTLFATAATTVGWGPLTLIWCGLMVVGILASLPIRESKKTA